MKQTKLYWLLIGVAFLFFSCGTDQPQKIDKYAQIQKKWTDEKGNFLHLTNYDEKYIDFANGGGISVKKKKRQKFTAQIITLGGKEIQGTWQFLKGEKGGVDSLELTYIPDAVVAVEKVEVVAKNGKKDVVLTDADGNTYHSKILKLQQIKRTFAVKKLTATSLFLKDDRNENIVIGFFYKMPSLETAFSLTSLLRGLLGIFVLLAIAFAFSANRKKISWKTVGFGLLLQVALAFGILKVDFVQSFFEQIGNFFVVILDFTKEGSTFLFGGFMDVDSTGFIFAFQVLPTIIFFAALTSLLFYLGIIQKVVYGLAWGMTKLLGISGAESLSVAGE